VANELDRFHLLYAGSVKNVRSHPDFTDEAAFEFTDDYSIFDWGKMPDPIPGKGSALLELAIHFFEKLENPNSWRIFFGSEKGKELEKELEKRPFLKKRAQRETMALASHGLRTHYRGFVPSANDPQKAIALRVESLQANPPEKAKVFGENTPDYGVNSRNQPTTLIPLEVVFRFELTPSSSLLKRKPDGEFRPGQKFSFPYLECFTKLEESDRFLGMSESLFVGRIDTDVLEELLLKTVFVSAFLRADFHEKGLSLLDGKLEWGLNSSGKLILADAIGPDELRITHGGVSLSKEKLREHYRSSDWFKECEARKKEVGETGNWQALVRSEPTPLPAELRESIQNLYLSLANTLIGREVFPAPTIEKTAEALRS
jgi:phosphoribosylaminoimidazole-succinocarboxamide synthase